MIVFAAAVLAASLCAPASAMYAAAPLPPSADRPLTPVILDPGHGGDDFGAVVKGMNEKDIALAVALKLRDRIKDVMPVVMTRHDDTFVPLDHRVVDSVDWDGAVFVSIHLNKVRDSKRSGAIVYSYGPELRRHWRRRPHHRVKVPPMPAPPRVDAAESRFLAGSMVRALREDGLRAEEAKSDFYVLKSPSQPSILVELGYLSNPAEAARLDDPAYQDKLADAMAKAIEGYAIGRSLLSLRSLSAAVPAAPSAAHL